MAEKAAAPPGSPDAALRRVLDPLVTAGGDGGPLRDDILASWRRCVLVGLRPDHFEVPYDANVDDGGRLSRAASAVIDRVGDDLEGTKIGLFRSEERRVG